MTEKERLRRSVEIAAGLRADELRVDGSRDARVRRGGRKTLRRGLPPEGAREGVTYHDVEVGIRVEGEPEKEATPSEDPSGRHSPR